jgi:hypothetical protein
MSDTSFLRFLNFPETVTEGNYKLAHEIFNKHDSLLHGGIADPDLLLMYNFFHPYQNTYSTAYTVWNNLKGQGTGGTQNLKDMMRDLSGTRIRKWDIAIQQIYDQTTSQYRNLLPHRRTPFQQASYESRITAVGALLLAIGGDVSLFDLESEVSLFLTQIKIARDSQVGGFGAIEAASTTMETARIAAAQAMFKNYGSLVVKYYMTPQGISDYMPTELLQSKQQSSFTGHLTTSVTHRIFKRKLDIQTQQLTLTNNGNNALEFYFTDGLTDVPSANQLVQYMVGHSQKDISPNLAGYNDVARYLHVRMLGTGESSWIVVIE